MGRDLELERAWREQIGRFERSGLTIQQFCDQEGLVGHQLSWWRRELKRRSAESGPRKPKQKPVTQRRKPGRPRKNAEGGSFVPVQVQPPNIATSSVEIILDLPPRIAVRAGFDGALLREVIRVLESR